MTLAPLVCRIITNVIQKGSILLNINQDFSGIHLIFDAGLFNRNDFRFTILFLLSGQPRVVIPFKTDHDRDIDTKEISLILNQLIHDTWTEITEEFKSLNGFDPTWKGGDQPNLPGSGNPPIGGSG